MSDRRDGRRTAFEKGSIAVAVGIVLLLVGSPNVPLVHSTSIALPPAHTLGPVPPTVSVVRPSRSGANGFDGAPGPFLDVPRYFAATSGIHSTVVASPAPTPRASTSTAGEARPTPPKAGPLPSTGGSTITGQVFDSVRGQPLGAVKVISGSVFGACAPCNTTYSDTSGRFSVGAVAGAVQITFGLAGYLNNTTWVTAPSSGSLSIGDVYLVHVAWIDGTVRGDLPGTPPIANVQIVAISRDGSIAIEDPLLTTSNGTFNAAIPPLPTKVTFAIALPFAPFLANWTWVNATPWQTIDAGTIFLEGGINLSATLVDAETGAPIPSGIQSQINVCPDALSSCDEPIYGYGPNVNGYAPPGPTRVTAMASGYLVNSTALPDIPRGVSSFNVGRIDLVPLGAIEVTVNLTGGTPSSTGWAAGTNGEIYVCTLDGLLVAQSLGGLLIPRPCWNSTATTVGRTVLVGGAPYRDVVVYQPVETEFPTAALPLPGGLPLYWPSAEGNITWVNLTPDHITPIGSFDLTPGNYLAGNVSVVTPNGTVPATVFTVTVCSMDESAVCGGTVPNGGDATIAGCPTLVQSFCAPAPPGPDELVVTVPASALYGASTNRTWVTVPYGCCGQDGHPQYLRPPTIFVNQGESLATFTGRIELRPPGGGPPAPPNGAFVSLTACAVAASQGGSQPLCEPGTVDPISGNFTVTEAQGWTQLIAAAKNYESNWTWVDGVAHNASGTIVLQPKGLLGGQVVDTAGNGIYLADISDCPIAQPQYCSADGASTSGTDGSFNVTVDAAPVPGGTYEVEVGAAGYTANWTWTNASPGEFSNVGRIVLGAVGAEPPRRTAAPLGALSLVGSTWVAGRAMDARTGDPVGHIGISACPVPAGSCLFPDPDIVPAGLFNFSLPRGVYDLGVSSPGYTTSTIYVNATGDSLALDTVALDPLAWLRGRIVANPWASLERTAALGASDVVVTGCDSTETTCGPSVTAAPDGSFNVSIPFGAYSQIRVLGTGAGVLGSAVGGFSPAGFSTPVSSTYSTFAPANPADLGVSIFGALAGSLGNGLSWNATRSTDARPAGFAFVASGDNGATASGALAETGGGGGFIAILPGDGTGSSIYAYGSAFVPNSEIVKGAVRPGTFTDVTNLSLAHFGYVQLTLLDRATKKPLGFGEVTAEKPDPANASTLRTESTVDQAGFVNFSAPAGGSITISTNLTGYANTSTVVGVAPGRTTGLGNVSLVGSNATGPAWISSAQVNTVGHPPTPTVVDGLTGAPLADAVVVVSSPAGVASGPVMTNGLGQFLASPPPGTPDSLYLSEDGYSPSTSYLSIPADSSRVVKQANLTGDGILAGRVVSIPGDLPVAGVEVQGCPTAGGPCYALAFTNGAGLFWIASPPGQESLTVQTDSYLANVTVIATASSDTWSWVGTIPVYSLATLVGVVRGIPSGGPIDGANVSLCVGSYPPPYGACGFSATTDANGNFVLPTPPGTFDLVVSAIDFNTSARPIAIAPGVTQTVGTIFLLQWGIVEGTVVTAPTHTPIANASVQACAAWNPGDCSQTVTTNATGSYLLLAPSGPVELLGSASGYLDNTSRLVVDAGSEVTAAPLLLTPIPPATVESISGTVLGPIPSSGGPQGLLVGAFVSLVAYGASVASTATTANGSFLLSATWGTYRLDVRDPGYASYDAPVALHSNVTGRVVVLASFRYAFYGTAVDRATGVPVPGIELTDGNTSLGTTNGSGGFAIDLPNGTYSIVARPVAGAAYDPLALSVTINGANQGRTLDMTAAAVRLAGSVTDVETGLPIPGASVSIGSVTTTGVVAVSTLTAATDGSFSASLAAGTYTLTVSAPGFQSTTVTIALTAGGPPIAVELAPTGGASAAAFPTLTIGAIALVGGGAALVAYWLARRRPPEEPEPNRWSGPAPLADDEDLFPRTGGDGPSLATESADPGSNDDPPT